MASEASDYTKNEVIPNIIPTFRGLMFDLQVGTYLNLAPYPFLAGLRIWSIFGQIRIRQIRYKKQIRTPAFTRLKTQFKHFISYPSDFFRYFHVNFFLKKLKNLPKCEKANLIFVYHTGTCCYYFT